MMFIYRLFYDVFVNKTEISAKYIFQFLSNPLVCIYLIFSYKDQKEQT